MKIGYNGSVTDADKAVISVYDHGFLYGMGLFETFRTYGGKPYLLERHLVRLTESCRALGIQYEPSGDDCRKLLAELMETNGLTDAYVRLTVSAGEGELGLPSGAYERPNVLMMVKPLPQMNERLYTEGRELRLLRTRRNSPEGEIRLKSLHYMNNIIAKQELNGSGAALGAEGLMLTREGWLAEGIVSNLFFIPSSESGKICTPGLDTGILPGITRGRVLELAAETGFGAEEGHYLWDDLLDAREIWVTNSIQELVPVTRLSDEHGQVFTVGNGRAGEAVSGLLAAYRKETNALAEQGGQNR
jgi:4-amino-4-deoxychorismate lyase